jgi:predicted nuclease with TOPRIM domain
MSAYLWAVQIGMPEGMKPSDQQLWLHKWLLGKQSEIERLTAERDRFKEQHKLCLDEIERLRRELEEVKERERWKCNCESCVEYCMSKAEKGKKRWE